MQSAEHADLPSVASWHIADAIGGVPAPDVKVLGRSSRTGALVCRVRHGDSLLFAKIYLHSDVVARAPRLLPSDQRPSLTPDRISAREAVEREWVALSRVVSVLGQDAVPRPIARSDRVLLSDWIKGVSLQRMVERTRRPLGRPGHIEAVMRDAGTWLRRLHEATTTEDEMVLDINYEADSLSLLDPKVPTGGRCYLVRARSVLDEAGRRLGTTTLAVPVVGSHGDYSLPNLIAARAGVVVMDFEHFGRRLALYDVVAFIANLRTKLVDPRYRRREALAWEAAFWEGYKASPVERLLGSALATVWILSRFGPRIARRRGGPRAVTFAERLGRGFAEDLLAEVTWGQGGTTV